MIMIIDLALKIVLLAVNFVCLVFLGIVVADKILKNYGIEKKGSIKTSDGLEAILYTKDFEFNDKNITARFVLIGDDTYISVDDLHKFSKNDKDLDDNDKDNNNSAHK